jgi:hypothetical protein
VIRGWSWPPENAKDAKVAGSAALWSVGMESRWQRFPIFIPGTTGFGLSGFRFYPWNEK